MKKLGLLVMPLMAISLLTNCNKTKQYMLTVTSEDESKGTVSGGGTYEYGSSVTITATPSEHYNFNGWYNGETRLSDDSTYNFSMPAKNITYTAKFSGDPHTVTVTSEDESKGTVSGGGTYGYGSSVTITASPKEGYVLEGWYKDNLKVSQSTSYTFNMPDQNETYIAKFVNENAWYIKSDWWNYCSNGKEGEQATNLDIGREVDLTVNNQVHKVRLIDIEHDDLYYSSGKAHCTFEFANLLSDSDGYSLTTFWDNRLGVDTLNQRYFDNSLIKELDGAGTREYRWYQKGLSARANIFKSARDMLPNGLRNVIKIVKKSVATTAAYDVNTYEAQVFALTRSEMTEGTVRSAQVEGSIYQYYKDHTDDSFRIKHQVKWHEDAATKRMEITDLDYTSYNYAGYNHTEEVNGAQYWLATPHTFYTNRGWAINEDGSFNDENYEVYKHAIAVAPAFCI